MVVYKRLPLFASELKKKNYANSFIPFIFFLFFFSAYFIFTQSHTYVCIYIYIYICVCINEHNYGL